MNTQIPNHDVTIDYPIGKVVEAIKLFSGDLKLNPDGYYSNSKNTNEMFNIFAYNIWKTDFIAGGVTGSMNVTLTKVDEGKTRILLQSVATTQGPLDNSRIVDVQNDYLKKLQMALSGQYVTPPPVADIGCLGVLLMMIIVTTLATMLILN